MFVSYESLENNQPWTVDSGVNFKTILKVKHSDQINVEVIKEELQERIVSNGKKHD